MRNLKKSNKNIEAEIDLSNGKVYNGFQKWWHNIKEGHFSLSKHIKNLGIILYRVFLVQLIV